jgi:O-antigen/teichoic acid export membrane protein
MRARRRPLGLNVVANLATVTALLLTALISVPLILHDVGLAGYGIWTLAQTLILWVTTAEAGFGPAVQRFVAVEHGAANDEAVRRLLWSTCLAYTVVGALLAGLAALLAPVIVDVFSVPAALHHDAIVMFRISAVVIWLALLVAGLGNVQQGLERFTAAAVTAGIGAVVFFVALVALLAAGLGLQGLALAAVLQQLSMLAVRWVDLRHWFHRPGLLGRREATELGSFTLRLQVTSLSLIVNSQTDRVVVGLVASPATLGQLGIGSQIAEAGRLLSGAALAPIVSRLAVTHGAGDTAGFRALFERLQRLWMLLIIGGTIIGAAVIAPLIFGWLGDGHGQAAVFGAVLVVAYGVGLLTGVGVAYLRAIGKPSIEARYGLIVIALNVVLTVALGVVFGAYGVVVATAVASAIGVAWFFAAFRREVGPRTGHVAAGLLARAVGSAALAAAGAYAWGRLMDELLPTGVALVGVVAGASAAGGLYLTAVTGVRPTRRNVRQLLGGA